MRSSLMLVALSVLCLATAGRSEIPQVLGYQGRITENTGVPVANGTYPMQFRIYDAETGGTPLWDSGSLSVETNAGVFSVMLGETPQPPCSLAFNQDYWLLVTYRGENQLPRKRLGSVGYAYMASGLVPGTEVSGPVDSGTSAAIKGANTSTVSYTTFGLYGQSASGSGRGVHGEASSSSGDTRGVSGVSMSSSGVGVHGYAGRMNGSTYGVHGTAESSDGYGVYGQNLSSGHYGYLGGDDYGVYGLNSNGHYGSLGGDSTGVHGVTTAAQGSGVYGEATHTSGTNYGVHGEVESSDGYGVYGANVNSNHYGYLGGNDYGAYGHNDSGDYGYLGGSGFGVYGSTGNPGGKAVYGCSSASSSIGVWGECTATTGSTHGVLGRSLSTGGAGVLGESYASTGYTCGIEGLSTSTSGRGVQGWGADTTGIIYGVHGVSFSTSGTGVFGGAQATSGTNCGVRGATMSPSGYAGLFQGDVLVVGSLSKGGGSFLIDHPLDPENKLLRHNFMESPENLVVYRGKATLDGTGEAVVPLPGYFAALTKEAEATVTLTPIGRPFLTGYEFSSHHTSFIVYGEPNREVSWVAWADRDDPVMRHLARPVEEEKSPVSKYCDQGELLYPTAYGYPESMGRDYEDHEKERLRMEERRRRVEEERARQVRESPGNQAE